MVPFWGRAIALASHNTSQVPTYVRASLSKTHNLTVIIDSGSPLLLSQGSTVLG